MDLMRERERSGAENGEGGESIERERESSQDFSNSG